MITHKEYKVLCTLKEINDIENQNKEYASDYIFMSKISQQLKYKDYELNEIMRSLYNQELVVNIFNDDTKEIYGAKVIDAGLLAIQNYHRNLFTYIFDKYIWIVLISAITSFLTAYFTCKFTI